MKKVLLSSLALLFLVTGCTKPASKEDDDEPQEIQIEEETEIEIEEGEVSGGL